MAAVVLCRPSPLHHLGLSCGRHMWCCEATPHGVSGKSPVGPLVKQHRGRSQAWPVGAVSAGSLSLGWSLLPSPVLILKRRGYLYPLPGSRGSRRGHWPCFLPPGPASPTSCIIGNFHLKIFLSNV
uniref:Uncharacterized protein n=1 Tax=Cebus imitator TaxID=2715852 RepID=A0A2K5PGV2_CEBIM